MVTCEGRGARGPCGRRPPKGERFCAFHRDQSVVVDLPSVHVQDADLTVSSAVAKTLDELDLQDSDAAIVRLTQRYAATIDAATDRYGALESFGPKLRAALESLGATPAARAKVTKGAAGDQPAGALGRIRSARSS